MDYGKPEDWDVALFAVGENATDEIVRERGVLFIEFLKRKNADPDDYCDYLDEFTTENPDLF